MQSNDVKRVCACVELQSLPESVCFLFLLQSRLLGQWLMVNFRLDSCWGNAAVCVIPPKPPQLICQSNKSRAQVSYSTIWTRLQTLQTWIQAVVEYSKMPSTVNGGLLPPGGNTSAGHEWMYQGSCCSSIMSLSACVWTSLGFAIAVHQEFYFRNFLNVLLLFNFIIGTFFPPCIVTNFFQLLVLIFCLS